MVRNLACISKLCLKGHMTIDFLYNISSIADLCVCLDLRFHIIIIVFICMLSIWLMISHQLWFKKWSLYLTYFEVVNDCPNNLTISYAYTTLWGILAGVYRVYWDWFVLMCKFILTLYCLFRLSVFTFRAHVWRHMYAAVQDRRIHGCHTCTAIPVSCSWRLYEWGHGRSVLMQTPVVVTSGWLRTSLPVMLYICLSLTYSRGCRGDLGFCF